MHYVNEEYVAREKAAAHAALATAESGAALEGARGAACEAATIDLESAFLPSLMALEGAPLDFLFLTFHSVAVFSRFAAAGLEIKVKKIVILYLPPPPPPQPTIPIIFFLMTDATGGALRL